MAATILDGKAAAATLQNSIRSDIAALKARGIVPGLAVILVGADPASVSYVTSKERDCAALGIESFDNRLPAGVSEEELIALVRRFNADPKVHGILVQLPLPRGMDEDRVLSAIDPDKDADGLHPVNLGRLVRGEDGPRPCTPHGIVKMLELNGIELAGKRAVVVGRSSLVGKPLALLLMGRDCNATVTVCHTGTRDLASITREADILVAAVGKPRLITGPMVKPGAVVVDVGVNRVEDSSAAKGYRLVGDVDFESVREIASAITPVPGGVGPLTRTMLLYNTVRAASR
jgi:methylenetetrahydrofolate dehydrogenase (NADP+) / methenyltetrahydrofolate cyclohydrolase